MIRIAICEDDLFYMEKERTLIEDYFKANNLSYGITTYASGIELTESFREDFDFASALAGDDVDKMKEMQAAMEKGFKQTPKSFGKSF